MVCLLNDFHEALTKRKRFLVWLKSKIFSYYMHSSIFGQLQSLALQPSQFAEDAICCQGHHITYTSDTIFSVCGRSHCHDGGLSGFNEESRKLETCILEQPSFEATKVQPSHSHSFCCITQRQGGDHITVGDKDAPPNRIRHKTSHQSPAISDKVPTNIVHACHMLASSSLEDMGITCACVQPVQAHVILHVHQAR